MLQPDWLLYLLLTCNDDVYASSLFGLEKYFDRFERKQACLSAVGLQ
jgi:hypothetical protein